MGKEQDLCDAAFKKDLAGVKNALDAGANPNCTDTPKKYESTPQLSLIFVITFSRINFSPPS